jgi:hypothetical protein
MKIQPSGERPLQRSRHTSWLLWDVQNGTGQRAQHCTYAQVCFKNHAADELRCRLQGVDKWQEMSRIRVTSALCTRLGAWNSF